MILDEDGDESARVRSSNSKALPGDHGHAVLWDASMHALRPRSRRWRQCTRGSSQFSDSVMIAWAQWAREGLDQVIADDRMDQPVLDAEHDSIVAVLGAEREFMARKADDAVARRSPVGLHRGVSERLRQGLVLQVPHSPTVRHDHADESGRRPSIGRERS